MVSASYGKGLSRSIVHTSRDTAVATIRSSVSGPWNWERSRFQAGTGFSAASSLGP